MRKAICNRLIEHARANPNLLILTGDSGYLMFEGIPARQLINCGTGEQAMVGVGAGLAIQGFRVVVTAITPFLLERAFEQVKLDVVQQRLPIVLLGSSDYPECGPTHNELSAFAECSLLGLRYYGPTTAPEGVAALDTALALDTPSFIRMGRVAPEVPRTHEPDQQV